MHTSRDWHEDVYRKVDHKRMDSDLRLLIMERDWNKCVVCEGRKTLEIHHIVPRSEGGGDNSENLITLCKKCHDEVELAEYRSAVLIRNHTPEWKHDDKIPNKKRVAKVKKVISEDGTEVEISNWQSWVYGGAKNPHI